MAEVPLVPEFPGTAFALPAAVLQAQPVFARALLARHVTWRLRTATAGFFRVPVALFEASTPVEVTEVVLRVADVLGMALFEQFGICHVGSREVALFQGMSGTVTIMKAFKGAPDPEGSAYKVYPAVLAEFSRVTGSLLNFELHEELEHPTGRASRPDIPGWVRIMTYATPPGEFTEHRIVRAFGLPLDQEMHSVRTCRPVPGRGVVLSDGESELVQILGNTWYFLVPMVDIYNDATSREIFSRLVALAWNHWQKPVKPERHRAATRKSFCAAANIWTDKAHEVLDKGIKTLDIAIERFRQDINRIQRDRQRLMLMRAALGDKHIETAQADLAIQWRRLRRHRDIDRIEALDDGLNITTRPVVVEHDGKRYFLGRFVVRIGVEGVLSVWNLDILHPEGVPHPHIKKDGGPCFGNADDAISQAAAQYRYADAIEYTLRWLTEGYHPELALSKIEEWPAEPAAAVEEAS